MFKALSIAGSDPCGGAGIQADLKTMTAFHVYGMTAITALTVQNTTGVKQVMEVDREFFRNQLVSVLEDIEPDAVKTGMIPSAAMMEIVADCLLSFHVRNLVIDPVMAATSGMSLMADGTLTTLLNRLLPLGTLITPNIPEAQVLCGHSIHDDTDMEEAARFLYEHYGCNVLLKGGHAQESARDYLYSGEVQRWFTGERIDNPNTHGTGCTLSSAITSCLAGGMNLEQAVERAKQYMQGAIAAGLDLGHGRGPLDHMYAMSGYI